MEFLSQHFGEILMAVCTLGMSGMAAYIAIKIALARTEEKHIAEKEAREMFQKWEIDARTKIEAKVDRHIENPDIHVHRRDTDPTGYFHQYGS